jgi:hypothetical protein
VREIVVVADCVDDQCRDAVQLRGRVVATPARRAADDDLAAPHDDPDHDAVLGCVHEGLRELVDGDPQVVDLGDTEAGAAARVGSDEAHASEVLRVGRDNKKELIVVLHSESSLDWPGIWRYPGRPRDKLSKKAPGDGTAVDRSGKKYLVTLPRATQQESAGPGLAARGAAGPDEADHLVVELRLPPAAEFLRLARYAAADAATRAGLGIDAIDDVRLAVSELCTLLTGSDAPIVLRFAATTTGVVVEGEGAPGPQLVGENGELAQTLVEAVVDEYRFDVVGKRAQFRVTKRRNARDV